LTLKDPLRLLSPAIFATAFFYIGYFFRLYVWDRFEAVEVSPEPPLASQQSHETL
jgi:hypothetical protein